MTMVLPNKSHYENNSKFSKMHRSEKSLFFLNKKNFKLHYISVLFVAAIHPMIALRSMVFYI